MTAVPRQAPRRPAPTRADAGIVEVARRLPVDGDYLRTVVGHLSSLGSSRLGFRTAGTPEDRAAAEFVAGEMRAIGLSGVAVEQVPVDAWRFRDAFVELNGGQRQPAAAFGGVPPTADGGLRAPLVHVGTGRRRVLDRVAVAGQIALVDWASAAVGPNVVGLELGLRGAVGMIVSVPDGGPYYQSPDALGSFDSSWHAAAPPMVTVSRRTGALLRAACAQEGPVAVTMTLRAEVAHGVPGCNVVGYLPGRSPGPVVVGAHHDGWFRGAFDNASGVAAMLAMARGLCALGYQPAHDICFTSRTAEEYGLACSDYDWCIGAWNQVTRTHPAWAAAAPFALCVEASGHPGLRSVVEAPVELAAWARRLGRVAGQEGWLPTGWRLSRPVTGTEQWSFLVAGIPGVAAYAWETSFARTDYHTDRDTVDLLDFALLARQARFYTLLALDADRNPAAMLDTAARGRHLARSAGKLGPAGNAVAAAALRHGSGADRRTPRDAFSAVGRRLLAVDGAGATCYPHEQVVRDLAGLCAAEAALADGNLRRAAAAMSRVGANALTAYLSRRAFTAYLGRRDADQPSTTWGSASHPTASPDLWDELAALRREPGARPAGEWIAESVHRCRRTGEAELERRLAGMTAGLR